MVSIVYYVQAKNCFYVYRIVVDKFRNQKKNNGNQEWS